MTERVQPVQITQVVPRDLYKVSLPMPPPAAMPGMSFAFSSIMKRRGSGRARHGAPTDDEQRSSGTKRSTRRLSTQEQASQTAGIADALVIKDGGLYFLCDKEADVPCSGAHGLGLYYHDCRFPQRL